MGELRFSVFPSDNFVDLCLYQFGREQCAPLHSFGPATRNHYLFHYVISGTGTLYANDINNETQTYQIKSRQGFMIFPNQINTYIADEELPWEYIWVEFDGLRVREALDMSGLAPSNPIYRAHSGELRGQMLDEMIYMTENKDASTFNLIGFVFVP